MSIALPSAGDGTYHSPEGCGFSPATRLTWSPSAPLPAFGLPSSPKGGEGLKVRRQLAPTELKPRPSSAPSPLRNGS
jgi:hypothetical protein